MALELRDNILLQEQRQKKMQKYFFKKEKQWGAGRNRLIMTHCFPHLGLNISSLQLKRIELKGKNTGVNMIAGKRVKLPIKMMCAMLMLC